MWPEAGGHADRDQHHAARKYLAHDLTGARPAAYDHRPDRVKARNLFNFGLGTDNLFHKVQGGRVTLRLAIENLTNKVTPYNFLSTFSGTHFVPPRTYQVSIGSAF